MVADKCQSTSDWVLPYEEFKIVRFGNPTHTLVGSSGLAGLGQFTKELQDKHNAPDNTYTSQDCIEDLCKWTAEQHYDTDSGVVRYMIVVAKGEFLGVIDGKGYLATVAKHQEYWAIGSGDELCRGFLAGLVADPNSKRAGDISAIDAVHAIRYAATRNRGVSAESTTEFIP